MKTQIQDFFEKHDGLSFHLVSANEFADLLDKKPFGINATCSNDPELLEKYFLANRKAFRGRFEPDLALPGWVYADLFLMPGVVGVLLNDGAIVAGYYAAPSLRPGHFIGVSLLSFLPGAGSVTKALTLKSQSAVVLRGVSRFEAKSIRSHCRLGSLRLLGAPPAAHEYAADSFVYETTLWSEPDIAAEFVSITDIKILRDMRDQKRVICSPGVDNDLQVCFD